jgi:hypothetical protein
MLPVDQALSLTVPLEQTADALRSGPTIHLDSED